MEKDENIIFAPFNKEQIESLNDYQKSGAFHEFTCGNLNHPEEKDNILIATENGWICPFCNYTQNWAWKGMSNNGIIQAMNNWRKQHGVI